MRSPGLGWHNLPLFVWSIFIVSFLLVFSLPVLAGSEIILPTLNSTIFWELFENYILFKTQSAGNPLYLNITVILRDYTSEFICCQMLSDVTAVKKKDSRIFDISSINFKYYQNLSNLKFTSYLTGLIEGNGTIIVPKLERSNKGRINYPSIQIIFNLKDLPLALLIQKELKLGSLNRKKGVNAYILTINSYEGLLLITFLTNGYFRTPKIYALWNLIDWLNIRFNELNLIKKPLDTSSLNSNAWLAGFIEADGHFSIRTTTSKYTKIECKFELSQRQIDHNNKSNLIFLEIIAKFLLTSVKSIRLDRPKPEYRLRTTSLNGNLVLVNYLNNWPLFGSKYLNYKDWLKVLELFKLGKFYHKENIDTVISIKSNMNDRRTIFNWDHLQNFYNLDK